MENFSPEKSGHRRWERINGGQICEESSTLSQGSVGVSGIINELLTIAKLITFSRREPGRALLLIGK